MKQVAFFQPADRQYTATGGNGANSVILCPKWVEMTPVSFSCISFRDKKKFKQLQTSVWFDTGYHD